MNISKILKSTFYKVFSKGCLFYFPDSYGLGNTFIELGVLNYVFPEKVIFCIIFKGLNHKGEDHELEIFGNNIKVLKYFWGPLERVFIILVKKFFKFVTKLRIISFIGEKRINNTAFDISIKKGIFSKIVFVKEGCHFQIPKYFNKISLPIDQNKEDQKLKYILKKDNKFLNLDLSKTCFVHIRRGDYLYWPDKQSPAVLDLNWYKKAINLINQKCDVEKFIIFTNDIFYVKDYFSDDKKSLIFHKDVISDFIFMSQCKYGILSASTFSLLAAKISKNRYKSEQFFLAPKYWIGHRNKSWYPENLYFNWIEYI